MATAPFQKPANKPLARTLKFQSIFHPNAALVLPSGEKVLFKNGSYTATSESQALILEKHFSNAVRRVA
jgi:hypothetical protein